MKELVAVIFTSNILLDLSRKKVERCFRFRMHDLKTSVTLAIVVSATQTVTKLFLPTLMTRVVSFYVMHHNVLRISSV